MSLGKATVVLGIVLAVAALAFAVSSVLFGLRHDTVYASEFADARFERIAVGMSEEEVIDALGIPLFVSERSNGRFVREIAIGADGQRSVVSGSSEPVGAQTIDEFDWVYTRPGSESDHYYVRFVTFGPRGTVISKHASFYSD